MEFPSSKDLDEEQNEIYLNAGLDRPVLITGPPGSGKTVMGIYRAASLAAKQVPVWIVVRNRTLASFMGPWLEEAHEEDMVIPKVTTFHSWFASKWRTVFHRLPPGPRWVIDWDQVFEDFKNAPDEKAKNFFTEHLVIDEGQDFANDLYKLLGYVHIRTKHVTTVLADENQRLDAENNSTITEIRTLYNLYAGGNEKENRQYIEEYRLSLNHRNTLQIARVAREFYNGTGTGIPDLPKKEGRRPEYKNFKNKQDCVDEIVKFLNNNRAHRIGVIIASTRGARLRDKYYELLKRKLKNKVQYYNSDAPDDLDFHRPGRVTVIHKMSMKGLEFETVFVVELDAVNIEGAELDETKMAFYVAFSRPLERLFLCSSNLKDPDLPPLLMREEFKELRNGLLKFDFENEVRDQEIESFEQNKEIEKDDHDEEIGRPEETDLILEESSNLSVPQSSYSFMAEIDSLEEAVYKIIQNESTSGPKKFLLAQCIANVRIQKKTLQKVQAQIGGVYNNSKLTLDAVNKGNKIKLAAKKGGKVAGDEVLIITDMQNISESKKDDFLEYFVNVSCHSLYLLFRGISPSSSFIYTELKQKLNPKVSELK